MIRLDQKQTEGPFPESHSPLCDKELLWTAEGGRGSGQEVELEPQFYFSVLLCPLATTPCCPVCSSNPNTPFLVGLYLKGLLQGEDFEKYFGDL